MAVKVRKFLENVFSNSKVILVLFCFFSILPLITTDIILRYVLNPIRIDDTYEAVPILFNLFWIFFVVYTCRFIMSKKVGRIVYVIFTLLFGLWFFANYISFKMFSKYLWFESIFLTSEASNYITTIWQYINIKVVLVAIIYFGSILLTCILWQDTRIKNRILRILPVIICVLGVISVNTFMSIAIAKDKEVGAWEVWDKPTLVYDKFADANKSLNIAGIYQYTLKVFIRLLQVKIKFQPKTKIMPRISLKIK